MAINNFKPFGVGNGANVASQSDYELLAALSTGFTSGKASSAQINKVLRQSSVMGNVLAQFIANNSGNDVLDDGNTALVLTNLISAFNAANVSQFSAAKSVNGYVKLPNGIMIEWGSVATSSTSSTTVTFPVAFPSLLFNYIAVASVGTAGIATVASLGSKSAITVDTWSVAGNRAGYALNWMAIGY